jgi:RHS repeat-associated protein
MTSETRIIAGISKQFSYDYNLDGSLWKLHYPSGRVVTYTPDSAGRTVSAADSNGTTYASATFYANGAEYQRSMPGIYFSTSLNPRLQISGSYSDNGQVSSFFINKTYNYGTIHQNNGNISSIVDNKDTSRTQTFTYDILNRITSGYSAAATGTYSWGETYSVDPWGNLNIGPMGNKAHGGTFANASDNNNRPLGFTYDAAGNLTNTSQYVYDPENRIQVTAGTAYTYDADGQRVLKSNSSGTPTKRYWMSRGNILAEADGSGNLTAEYVFFGGKRTVRIDLPTNTVHYYLSDHLGSTSKVVNSAGVVEEESDFTAFGSELTATQGTNHYKFTSKERDSESQLDYFGARYYSNLMGRFSSRDPKMISKQRVLDPQQWNMYSYARNNPQVYVDPDGRELKIIIVNSSNNSDSVARQVGDRIASSVSKAGVKNVTVEVSHSPTWSSIKSELSTHVHSIEYGPNGGSTDVHGNVDNKDAAGVTLSHDAFGPGHGYSGVDTDKTGNDIEKMATTGMHELGHDAGIPDHQSSDKTDVMNSPQTLSGKQDYTPDEAKQLQKTYNSPGEVEKDQKTERKPDKLK